MEIKNKYLLVVVLLIGGGFWLLFNIPSSPLTPQIALSGDDAPPGTGTGGIVSPDQLIDEHQKIISQKSYKIVRKRPSRIRKVRIIYGQRMTKVEINKLKQKTIYIKGDTAFIRTQDGDAIRYLTTPSNDIPNIQRNNPAGTTTVLRNHLSEENFKPISKSSINGHTVIHFTRVGGRGYVNIRSDGLIMDFRLPEYVDGGLLLRIRTSSNFNLKSPNWISKAKQGVVIGSPDNNPGDDGCTDAEDGDNDGFCNDEWFDVVGKE